MASTVIQPGIQSIAPFTDHVYALKSDNGTFKGLFTQAIGTNNAVMFQSNGYSFGWEPDNILYIDDQNNMDVVYGVNASASAQYWNNKVTYVGTTQLTSDMFECLNNQLKHTVSMVAPPRLPASYMGTPLNVAVGGVISYDSSLSLVADGVKQTASFVTNGGLSFQDSTGKEVYSLPKIFAQDANGDIADGQYKVTFNSDGSISLYMMVAWSWLQTAQYPVTIDPTVVVASAYDTSGNGGRKIVRLSNNWIVVGAYASSPGYFFFYVSKDNGSTWSSLCYINASGQNGTKFSFCSSGTIIYAVSVSGSSSVLHYNFDANNITYGSLPQTATIESGQNSIGSGVSIAMDGTGALNAVWCSQNSTYPSSTNIRYSKSTNSGTTWTTPTQITTLNTTGWYAQNPCIVVNSSNVSTIVWETQQGSNINNIMAATWNGSSWSATTVYAGGSAQQSKPCAIVDSSNNIHVFWLSSTTTILHSVSTNGGSTWSAPDTVYTGTSVNSPSAGYESSVNECCVMFSTGSTATVYYVTGVTNSWNATTTVGAGTNPQTLWSEFNENASNAIYYVWDTGSSVDYDSVSLNAPPNAPTLTAHSNFDATVAQSLAWTFSDPNIGDTQSAYQLQIVDTGNSQTVVDTGKVASTISSYSLAANALTNGHNYQWRVTTWDQSNAQGPYSSYSTFSCATTPTVTITTPANNASVAQSGLTVQFSYSDPASLAQQSYQVQLLDSADSTVLNDSGTINGTNNQYTIPYTLANNTTYHVKVRATNSQGITSAWSDNTFSTSFTLPATPTLALSSQSGYISLTITNSTPTGGQPVLAYNDIYRRKTGTQSWTRIATNIANNGTYSDYAVASDQSYDYKITAVGNNQTSADSAVSSQSITFRGLMVHQVNNPSGLLNLLYQTQPKNDEWIPTSTLMKFAGRKYNVLQFGENEDYTLSGQQTVLMDSDNQWNALNNMIRSKSTLCVRDGRGRKIFAGVVDLKTTDLEFGRQVDLEFIQVDFNEVV